MWSVTAGFHAIFRIAENQLGTRLRAAFMHQSNTDFQDRRRPISRWASVTSRRAGFATGLVFVVFWFVLPHTKFHAEVYVLSKEEGGRHSPFFAGYRPQFYFRTTDVTGVIQLPKDVEMVMPGDTVTISAELITPIAMEKELRFAIREGGHTVGAGVISEILA